MNIFFNWVQTLKWSVSPLSLTTYGIPSGELCPAKFVFNMWNGSWSNKNSKKTARFHENLRGKRFEIQTLQSMTLWVRWFLNIMFVGDLLWQICLHWVRGTRFDQVWLNGVSCFNYYHLQERRWRSQINIAPQPFFSHLFGVVANHPSGCKAQIPRRAWVLWWRKGVSQRVPCHEAWKMMRWSGGSPRHFLGMWGVYPISLSLTPFNGTFLRWHSYFNFKGFEIRMHFCVQVSHFE